MSKGRVTRILRRAYDRFAEDQESWIKGDYHARKHHSKTFKVIDTYCLVGNLQASAEEESAMEGEYLGDDLHRAYRVVAEQIQPDVSYFSDGLENTCIRWNDDPYRTYEEVLEKLQFALKKADDQGL